MADPYHILGISSTASDADIDAAYKYMYNMYHPANHAGVSSLARYMRLFKQVQHAYMNLCERRGESRVPRFAPTSVPPTANQMLK